MSTPLIEVIFRDHVTDGVPSSGDHDPRKIDIRAWGRWVEGGITAGTLGGPWEATLAALGAKLAYADGNPGFVYDGADFGTYRKSGASGTGSWVKILDTIPGYQVVKATNAGAGTANAIVATSTPPVSYSDGKQIVSVNITTTNTSPTVTVNFNGLGDLTIKTAAGNDPAVGGLVAPVRIWGQVDESGTVFRMMSDQASAAIVTDAEAALASILEKYLGNHADDTAATAAAGGSPAEGALYWNTVDNAFRVYVSAAWTASKAVNNWSYDSFVGDGTDDPVELTTAPGSNRNMIIYVEGEGPQPPTIFPLSDKMLSPPSGEVWELGVTVHVFYGSAIVIDIGVPSAGSVGPTELSADAIPGTIHAATEKTVPVDDDEFGIADSAASWALKRLKWSSITAGIWSVFGVLIAAGTSKTTPVDGDYIVIADSAASNASKRVSIADLKAILSSSSATGQVAFFDGSVAPTGWVVANGGTIGNATSGGTTRANADTETLFAWIWGQYNNTARPIQDSAGAPSTRGASAAADFAANKRIPLPDPRGRAIRALDSGAGIDSGRAIGTLQADAMQGHWHNVFANQSTGTAYGWAGDALTGSAASRGTARAIITDGVNGTPRIAAETRMTNIALLACIKL